MGTAGDLVSVLCAVILMLAALRKATPASAVGPTLVALGFNRRVAGFLSIAVPTLEVTTALGLVLLRESIIPSALLALLGAGFFLAGLIAVLRRIKVRCQCIGVGSGTLGLSQIALFPVWNALQAAAASRGLFLCSYGTGPISGCYAANASSGLPRPSAQDIARWEQAPWGPPVSSVELARSVEMAQMPVVLGPEPNQTK